MNAQQKDKNESFIIAIYRGLGLWAQQMDRTAGYDLVVHGALTTKTMLLTGPWIAEVKSSEYKANRLTDNERETKAAIEAAGGKYPIIFTGQSAIDVFEISIDELTIGHLLGIANELTNLKDIDDDIKPMVQDFQDFIFSLIEEETFG